MEIGIGISTSLAPIIGGDVALDPGLDTEARITEDGEERQMESGEPRITEAG